MDELTRANWRKAKASQANGACVEVASLSGGRHAVRDSKANGEGPVLLFTEAEWAAFLDGAKNGEFDS
jgi:Domain of unknown function (DUF397)